NSLGRVLGGGGGGYISEDGLRITFNEVAGAVLGEALRFTAASPVGKMARSKAKRFCLTEASNLIDKNM
ncbi:MAG: hypothetical protein LBL45_12885, partial [Treponema sp.]|nr:hypothetical protein [Treponema sp.]